MLTRCAQCGRIKLSEFVPRCMTGWNTKKPEWWGMPATKGGEEDKGKISHTLCPDCARKASTGIELKDESAAHAMLKAARARKEKL